MVCFNKKKLIKGKEELRSFPDYNKIFFIYDFDFIVI